MSNVGTSAGDIEECQFVKDFNAGLFQDFCLEHYPGEPHVYAVRVTSKQFSNVTQKKVLTKSDAFLVSSKVDHGENLRSRSYLLVEEDLKELECEVLFGSGISIKSPNATIFFLIASFHRFNCICIICNFTLITNRLLFTEVILNAYIIPNKCIFWSNWY